jgi:hypothetical protein
MRLSHRSRNKSCGCDKNRLCSEAKTEHGSAHRGQKTRIYKAWCKLKERCYNANNERYARYGGRGIRVCQEWNDSFEAFDRWSKENGYHDALEIDRRDNNGDYTPDNCRWVTGTVSRRNRKGVKLSMEVARMIREVKPKGKAAKLALAASLGVGLGAIGSVLQNKTWKEGKENG